MTTLAKASFTCALCGAVGERTEVTSTSQFGAPDLDMRPPEMYRSTLIYWVVDCQSCGYTFGPDAEHVGASDVALWRRVVSGDDYRAQREDGRLPDAARRSLCLALLQEASGEPNAGATALWAAWACDDADDEAGARRCRLRAAELWERALERDEQAGAGRVTAHAILADIYRRAQCFEEARRHCAAGLLIGDPGPIIERVLHHQLALTERGDDSRQTLDDVDQPHA